MAGESAPGDERKIEIAQLYDSIDEWDSHLKSIPADSDNLRSEMRRAIDDLDEKWGMIGRMGMQGYVSGMGRWSEVVIADNVDDETEVIFSAPGAKAQAVVKHGLIPVCEGISNGFNIYNSKIEGVVISHMFFGKPVNIIQPLGGLIAYTPYMHIKVGTLKFIPKEEADGPMTLLESMLNTEAAFRLDVNQLPVFRPPQT